MAIPLRVLLVEDTESEAVLALKYLEKAGFAVSCLRIETAAEMQAALKNAPWDIVISDYALPSFSAPAALRILQDSGVDIPFIVVSGTISEEVAIDLMRAGAADYLLKDRLIRLGVLVKRELNIAQVRKERNDTRLELRKSQDWSNLIYNATADAMFLLAFEPADIFRYVSFNSAYGSLLGLNESQAIGKRPDEVFPAAPAARALAKYKEAIQAGQPIQFEETSATHSGELTFLTTLTPICDPAGGCTHLLGSMHDISARKKAELLQRESEERFRLFVERSNDAFYRQNFASGRFEYVSPKIAAIVGYSAEELMTWDCPTQMKSVHPDDLSAIADLNADLLAAEVQGANHLEREFRLRDIRGEYQWVHGSYALVRGVDGSPLAVIGSLSNISHRKQVENDLRADELYLRTILQTAPEGFVLLDCEGKILDVNKTFVEMSGFSAEELKQLAISDLDVVEEPAQTRARMRRVISGLGDRFETRHRKKDGSVYDVEISTTFLMEDGGRLVCFCQDITERKRIEAAVENRIRALTSPLEIVEAVDFKNLFNLEDIQRLQDQFATATGVASLITYPDGTPITRPSNFCRFCMDLVRGTPQGGLNCKKSDAIIGRGRLDGPVVQPCMSGGLWDAGAAISVNGQHVASWLVGQVRDEAVDEVKIREYARAIGAEEDSLLDAFYEVPAMPQAHFKAISQALFTMSAQLSTIAYHNFQQARFITELKQGEAELQHWAELFQNAAWGIAIGSADGRSIDLLNPAIAKMHGYTAEEMSRLTIQDLFAPQSREKVAENIQLAHVKGHHVWEAEHLHKDGHTFPVEIDMTAVLDERQRPLRRVVYVHDITERKKIEENLRLSEEKFSTAFRVSPDSININRLSDGLYLEINEGFKQLTGYGDEVIGKTSVEINIWVNAADRKRLVAELLNTGVVNNLEAPFRDKYGRIKICLMSACLIVVNGERCILSITRDISERKLKDEEYATFIHSSFDGFISMDESGHFLDVNEALCRMSGYPRAELLAMSIRDLDADETAESVAMHLHQVMLAGSDHFQTRHRRRDGSLLDVQVSAHYVANSKRVYIFIQDISAQMQAAAELQRNREELDRQNNLLTALLKTLPIGVVMVEAPSGRPLVANDAAYQLLGRETLPDATQEVLSKEYEFFRLPDRTRYPAEETPIVLGMRGVNARVEDLLLIRPDQSAAQLEVIGSPVYDSEGKIWASLVSFQDITERKQVEAKLKEQLEELRRWNAVTLGRELRILELKREVNDLLQKAGQPVRYASAQENGQVPPGPAQH